MVVEALNVIVNEAVRSNIFRGFKVGKEEISVSHLQYADDTMFFGECDV